jgi:hypothetical protein
MENIIRCSSSCSFLHSPVMSSFLVQIRFSVPCTRTRLIWVTKFHTHIKSVTLIAPSYTHVQIFAYCLHHISSVTRPNRRMSPVVRTVRSLENHNGTTSLEHWLMSRIPIRVCITDTSLVILDGIWVKSAHYPGHEVRDAIGLTGLHKSRTCALSNITDLKCI